MFASAARELEHPDKDTLQIRTWWHFESIQPRMTFNAPLFPCFLTALKQKIIVKFNERKKMQSRYARWSQFRCQGYINK